MKNSGKISEAGNKFKINYHEQKVAAHGSREASVFLVNEAPGDCETYYGIPSVASQGGNIYRALREAGVRWAMELNEFSWPTGIQSNYAKPEAKNVVQQFVERDDALSIRASYITCTNAYDRWPTRGKKKFITPEDKRVLDLENMERLRREATPNHRVLLICGKAAWLACHGTELTDQNAIERTQISAKDLQVINGHLRASFECGWYMGYTGRWTLKTNKRGPLRLAHEVLRDVAKAAGWPSMK